MSDDEAQYWAQMQAEAEAYEAEQSAAQAAEYEAAMEAEQAKPTMQPFRAWVAVHEEHGRMPGTLAMSYERCKEAMQKRLEEWPYASRLDLSTSTPSRDVRLPDGWRIVEVEVREAESGYMWGKWHSVKDPPAVSGDYLCILFKGDSGSVITYSTRYRGWNLGHHGDRQYELFPLYWTALSQPPEGADENR